MTQLLDKVSELMSIRVEEEFHVWRVFVYQDRSLLRRTETVT